MVGSPKWGNPNGKNRSSRKRRAYLWTHCWRCGDVWKAPRLPFASGWWKEVICGAWSYYNWVIVKTDGKVQGLHVKRWPRTKRVGGHCHQPLRGPRTCVCPVISFVTCNEHFRQGKWHAASRLQLYIPQASKFLMGTVGCQGHWLRVRTSSLHLLAQHTLHLVFTDPTDSHLLGLSGDSAVLST